MEVKVRIETRDCKLCDKPFEVHIKRGRPHTFCEDCRGLSSDEKLRKLIAKENNHAVPSE